MAIQRLVFCFASLVVLTASPAHCAPQGFMTNFGWPGQPDYTPRLPAQAFMPTETVPNPAPAMPSLWSPPAVAEPTIRQTDVAVQPPKLHKQFPVPQSRLANGSANRLSKQQTKINVEQVTTEKPVSDNNTEVRKPINAVESAVVPEEKPQLPKLATKLTPEEETDDQRLLEFIPAGVAALGAALGREGCRLKAACLAGGLIPSSIQGRDMMLLAAETLVPTEWKEVFQAAKSSMIERQDCSSFTCF
ncbi:uncharacterized protein LOC130701383 [Daphnia carinata]|uniref:uncharacterized protein LOC130701383 n=1 Tax=Daphnia carinata TaxID=120202 RepID=UPI00257B695F|nr:uncharacterized protein LOC130701383 [Daphnia carinata]